jgi:hypothetical protein
VVVLRPRRLPQELNLTTLSVLLLVLLLLGSDYVIYGSNSRYLTTALFVKIRLLFRERGGKLPNNRENNKNRLVRN